jgi:N-acetylglucosaminyl-diphospho-decaprenol L-rhamnosyltransferase
MESSSDPLGAVGVVIVSYRSANVIEDALRPLPVERLAEVVVVDNASPDDTTAVVRALDVPGIRLLVLDENVGFGAGNNHGVAALAVRAELVLLLNPDASIAPAALEQLVAYLDANPRCAVVAPQLLQAGTPIYSAGRDATLVTELRALLPKEIGWVLPQKRLEPERTRTGPVGYVEGACMLVRRDALTAIGGFDERYFLYFEELDIAHALRAKGWTVDLCREVTADHRVATATGQLPLAGRPVLIGSTVAYLRKWKGERAARLYAVAARLSWRMRVLTRDLEREAEQRLRSALDRAVAGERVVA